MSLSCVGVVSTHLEAGAVCQNRKVQTTACTDHPVSRHVVGNVDTGEAGINRRVPKETPAGHESPGGCGRPSGRERPKPTFQS